MPTTTNTEGPKDYLMPVLLPLAWVLMIVLILCFICGRRQCYRWCERQRQAGIERKERKKQVLVEKEMKTLSTFPIYTLSGNGGILTASPRISLKEEHQWVTNCTMIDTSKAGMDSSHSAFIATKVENANKDGLLPASSNINIFSERL